MFIPIEIALKKSIVYQLWYNHDMSNVIASPIKSKSWAKGLILILLISAVFLQQKHNPHRFIPDTSFTTITGKKLVFSPSQKKPLVVTFWATSCPSCVQEIPHLISLYDRYHPQGIEIIAIAMAYDPPNRVVAMTQEKNIPYAVVLDLKSEYANAFGRIWATPTTFLIKPNGRIAKRIVGQFDLVDLQTRIEALLKESPETS